MKFAGLDLSQVDLPSLSWKDLNIIHRAYVENYSKVYDRLDYQPADQIISLLKRYIKIKLINLGLLCNRQTDIRDLQMAMAIYVLPTEAKHPLIQQALGALDKFSVKGQIYNIKTQPFSMGRLEQLWGLIQPEKETLNFTGFWDKSAINLYRVVTRELLDNAYATLSELTRHRSRSPEELAVRYILLFHMLYFIKQRKQHHDFRFGLDVVPVSGALDDFAQDLIEAMQQCLQQIRDLPEKRPEQPMSLMLHRFKGMAARYLPIEQEPQRYNRRINPSD